MFDVILYAIPFFVLAMILEVVSFRFLPDDDRDGATLGYEFRDTRTSLIMGAGSVLINAGWKLVARPDRTIVSP